MSRFSTDKKIIRNQKGFTLVELLAAVVLLGVIISLGVMAYTSINENIREEQLANKLNLVEINAVKWAEENNLQLSTVITINKLIEDNYLQADEYTEEKPIYNNPVDGSSLLCYTIVIEKNGQEYTANVDMETGENCDLQYSEEVDSNIKVSAYKYEDGIIGEQINNINNVLDWVNKDVILIVSSDQYEYDTIYYTPRGGNMIKKEVNNNLFLAPGMARTRISDPDNYANVLLVKAKIFLDDTYTIGLYTDDGIKQTELRIRIDKENPSVTSSVSGAWTNQPTKNATLNGSDGSGSGLKGFYISQNENSYNTDSFIASDYSAIAALEAGTYYIWGEDNVGNIPEKYQTKLTVSNIDSIPPTIHKNTLELQLNDDFTYNISIDATDAQSGILGYYLGHESCETAEYDVILKENYTINKTYGDYNLCVKDQVGNISQEEIGAHISYDINFNRILVQNFDQNTNFQGNLIFVFDVSGSMISNSRLDNLKSITNEILDSLNFNGDLSVSIVVFDDSARILHNQSKDREALKASINSLTATGGNNYEAGLTQTKNLMNTITNDLGNYVIFLSDGGEDITLSPSYSDLLAVQQKASVYSIGVGSNASVTNLVTVCGGYDCYYSAEDAVSSLKQVFTDIVTSITEELSQLEPIEVKDGSRQLESLKIDSKYPVTITLNNSVLATYTSLNNIVYVQNGQFYFDLYKLMDSYNLTENDLNNIVVKYYYEEV